MSLHPLDPEIVRETDAWFYASHPRGRELRTPEGDIPLEPYSREDAAGRRAWVAEYRRRLAEKQVREDEDGGRSDGPSDDEQGGPDPLAPCSGCCPTDFTVDPETTVVETEESVTLGAHDHQSSGAGAGTFTWTTTSDKISLDGSPMPGSQLAGGPVVTVDAGTTPNTPPELGEIVEVTRTQEGCAPITKTVHVLVQRCKLFRLASPRIIAIAEDGVVVPTHSMPDPQLPGSHALGFGQDLEFGSGRAQPHGPSVGATVADLRPRMRRLLGEFASGDPDGKARRLFNDFLAPRSAPSFWSDPVLTAAAEGHPNIRSWISLALNAPTMPETSGRHRIHQALEAAGWDIGSAVPPSDLGAPAFNRGSPEWQSGDFDNGLGVMINGLQYVVVVAKEYYYDQCQHN